MDCNATFIHSFIHSNSIQIPPNNKGGYASTSSIPPYLFYYYSSLKNNYFAVSYKRTSKGSSQVHFEFAFYTLSPKVKVIILSRIPEFYERFLDRETLLEYNASICIYISRTKSKQWLMDESLA